MSAARIAQAAAADSAPAAAANALLAWIVAQQVVGRHPEEPRAVKYCPERAWDIAARSQVAAGHPTFAWEVVENCRYPPLAR